MAHLGHHRFLLVGQNFTQYEFFPDDVVSNHHNLRHDRGTDGKRYLDWQTLHSYCI